LTRACALLLSVASVCLFSTVSATAQAAQNQAAAKPLTVEAIFAHGPLIGHPPEGLTWSPDGKHLTYLDGGELVDLDPATAKSHVMVSRAKLAALAGVAGSETDRDHRERYKMASYLWAPDSAHLLFDSNGRLWLYDLTTARAYRLALPATASGDDPKFSPNGEMVSFMCATTGCRVLHLKEPGLPALAVAPPPNQTVLNGEVDWVYEEELDTHSNYFWSPDSKNLAYLQMNEKEVPEYPIVDWIPTHARVEAQRFPQPGDPNPDVRVGVVGAAAVKRFGSSCPFIPARITFPVSAGWTARRCGSRPSPAITSIGTSTLPTLPRGRHIPCCNLPTISSSTRTTMSRSGYGSIVLTNWTDGHNHLYLYSYDQANPATATAKLERQLTKGEFDVGDVLGVDHAGKLIHYASNEGNPLEQQLSQVTFDGDRKQLTTSPGSHDGNFAAIGGAFIDKQSTRMAPPTLRLCQTQDTNKCNIFWSTRAIEGYKLRAPVELQVKAHDGTVLYGTLLLPEGTSAASVPLIVNPYGGPGPQTVANRWGDGLLFDELLAQHGFAVLHADNRGTGMRGRDFAQAAYRNFGPVQLEDQLTVVDAVLAQYPQLDPKRLGWWGWSWGGTFTLYAMSHSDRFRAGVAVAPVTDWRNYDSIYTERYMGQPGEFPDGYRDFSVVNSATNLKGRLLLVHGTGDDNVHIENSVQFIQKLIEAELPYDLQIYPRKTHSIAGPDVRTHLYNRILAHFEEYLKPPAQ
jgi:dipeptidyl-peptidase-4